ncbi:hypothetical protein RCH23_001148 [Cryobacterium sp. CAN_C3]|nr:hypothetical protein [Cryobacterium sp. CAN_C3]
MFSANVAWLVLAVMAFTLTLAHAAARTADTSLAKATTATIRRKLVTVPARIASSARRLTLHLPESWPWEVACTALADLACGPPPAATTRSPSRIGTNQTPVDPAGSEARRSNPTSDTKTK